MIFSSLHRGGKLLDLLKLFRKAEAFVTKNFPEDIEWSRKALSLANSVITKQHFYGEYVFGVFVAGFRYSVVKSKMEDIRRAYFDFKPDIVEENAYWVKDDMMKILANERKIDATIKGAKMINKIDNWRDFLDEARSNIYKLEELPYVGPVTKYQIARNIGINIIKPDIHLVRLANCYKMDVFDMCRKIADETGRSLHMVDTIIWRSCEQGFIQFKS